MTLPVVERMEPDQRPTEAGWYVVTKTDWPGRRFIEFWDEDLVADPDMRVETVTFIARIYPERIGLDEI